VSAGSGRRTVESVGRLARAAGYRAVDERYLADDFWEHRVEQPSL
jgi:hypothetical protein